MSFSFFAGGGGVEKGLYVPLLSLYKNWPSKQWEPLSKFLLQILPDLRRTELREGPVSVKFPPSGPEKVVTGNNYIHHGLAFPTHLLCLFRLIALKCHDTVLVFWARSHMWKVQPMCKLPGRLKTHRGSTCSTVLGCGGFVYWLGKEHRCCIS